MIVTYSSSNNMIMKYLNDVILATQNSPPTPTITAPV